MIKKGKTMIKVEANRIKIWIVTFNLEVISININNQNNNLNNLVVWLISKENSNNNNKINKDKSNSMNNNFKSKNRWICTNNNKDHNNKFFNVKGITNIKRFILIKDHNINTINNFMKAIWEKLIKLQLKYMLPRVEKLVFNCGEFD